MPGSWQCSLRARMTGGSSENPHTGIMLRQVQTVGCVASGGSTW